MRWSPEKTKNRFPDDSEWSSCGVSAWYVTYVETLDLLRANIDRQSDEQRRKNEENEERNKHKARAEVEKQTRSVERKRKVAARKHKREE